MPKEEWGVKRLCPTTGKRFYDLNKTPIVSPYTGEVIEIENGGSSRKPASISGARPETAKDDEALVDDLDTDEELLEDDAADDSVDDDLLEDDDDDTVSLDDLADVSDDDDES
ncbi:TIGR02300 family protein [Acidimangrovimonas pyrenivorans]|uniref:TIGR02300 family protein n=1 Tax=Acidimangrovimonas pyrenivorans TaxID=2030798 RepID=A0ABV7AC79_9RHOB